MHLDLKLWRMTAGQRDLWKYAIANSPSGLLTPLDGPLLSVWCIAADMHQTACAAQAKRDANGFGPGGAAGRDPNGDFVGIPSRFGDRSVDGIDAEEVDAYLLGL